MQGQGQHIPAAHSLSGEEAASLLTAIPAAGPHPCCGGTEVCLGICTLVGQEEQSAAVLMGAPNSHASGSETLRRASSGNPGMGLAAGGSQGTMPAGSHSATPPWPAVGCNPIP